MTAEEILSMELRKYVNVFVFEYLSLYLFFFAGTC